MPTFPKVERPAEREGPVVTFRMQEEIYLSFERFRETPELQYAAKAACAGRCIGRQRLETTIAAIVEYTGNNYRPISSYPRCSRCGQGAGWYHNLATITLSRKIAVSYACEPIQVDMHYPAQLYQDKRKQVMSLLFLCAICLLLPIALMVHDKGIFGSLNIDVTSLLSLIFLLRVIIVSYAKQQLNRYMVRFLGDA